ncbi:MAG: thioredoxin-dependent thiol peroxidase [Bacteroides sp.]|nr:thioredoxin-dependent thiol peroxidase [Bacteroidales bacterium]MBD5378685.1 thioredoxin-dependent thiol peroxidase [Bacteroides sp.]MDE5809098.1 thioredoxin-dependent thiol peroxidase [Muribaculaceae bacterium]
MNIGDKVTGLLGYDAAGKAVNAEEFEGKPLIVYFYPKDNTPGCTAEACSIRDSYADLKKRGYVVIGISKDSSASHVKFAEKYELPFILLSDADTTVNQKFGVWQKKKMAGREYMGTVRTTFITDANHVVTEVINKVNTKDAAGQIIEILDKKA